MDHYFLHQSVEPVLAEYESIHVQAILAFLEKVDLRHQLLPPDPEDLDPSTYSTMIIQLLANLSESSYLYLLERLDNAVIQEYLLTKLSDLTLLEIVRSGRFRYLPIFDHFDDPLPLIDHVIHKSNPHLNFALFSSLTKRPSTDLSENQVLPYLQQSISPLLAQSLIHFVQDQDTLCSLVIKFRSSDILYQVLDRIDSPILLRRILNVFDDPSVYTQILNRIELLS
ncbi:MAG: hypothetical protein ACXAE3_13275 [Candidatus Kariarchaeaceae archaeon]|jgi:hypothetical protein